MMLVVMMVMMVMMMLVVVCMYVVGRSVWLQTRAGNIAVRRGGRGDARP